MIAMGIPTEVVELALKHRTSVKLDHSTGIYEIWNNRHLLACSRKNATEAVAVLRYINRSIEEKEAVCT